MIVDVLIIDKVPDQSGDIFDPKGVLIMPPPDEVGSHTGKPLNVVPVHTTTGFDENAIVGEAALFMYKNVLKAELRLFKQIVGPVYPAIVGEIIQQRDAIEGETGFRRLISKCRVRSLSLTIAKNQDLRIQPVCLT